VEKSIGLPKVMSRKLKTKVNVDHVGLFLLSLQSNLPMPSLKVILVISLNNNLSIVVQQIPDVQVVNLCQQINI
jgi:hypothetical protein